MGKKMTSMSFKISHETTIVLIERKSPRFLVSELYTIRNVTEVGNCIEFDTEDGSRALSFRFESIVTPKITTHIKQILMDFELEFKPFRNFK